MERIARETPRPDLVIATGDLAQNEPLPIYKRFQAYMHQFDLPVSVLPGNHDDPNLLAKVFGIETDTATAKHVNFGHTNLGNWLIIFLNTVVPGKQYGALDARELARMDTLLSDHMDQHALLCMHHHPTTRRNDDLVLPWLRNPDEFFSVMDRHAHVRGIICGHIHSTFEKKHGEATIFGTPSTCFQFNFALEQLSPKDSPPAYRRLMLKPDGAIESDVIPVLF